MKLFAVTGKPISHSKSPLIFNAVFSIRQHDATYFRLISDNIEESLQVFKEIDMSGLNITSPFKEDVLPLLDSLNDSVKIIGSVNTIINKDESLCGYNTDYIGVSRALLTKKSDFKNVKCLVIGAGGTANAVVYGMKQLGASVTIMNRTYKKANKLAKKLNVSVSDISNIETYIRASEVVISTLSAGINLVKKEWLNSKQIIFDVNYKTSDLYQYAKEVGCDLIKGEVMLVGQAVSGYSLFMNEQANSVLMFKAAYKEQVQKKHISLIGFMGAGKSSVGANLAEKLGKKFVDADKEIEKALSMTIPEIFSQKGEEEFRKIETKIMQEILKSDEEKVIAWGGGVVLSEYNREEIKKQSTSIWLHIPPVEAVARIKKGSRPILDVENPVQAAEEIYKKRIPFYALTSDMVMSVKARGIGDTADRVIEELNYFNK